VQAVVQELRGERVDIVPWTADPAEFVCRALLPAKVSKIIQDDEERSMEVIVPDDQLSLAIGKKGQNVKLASKLTNWQLQVRSESESELEHSQALASLTTVAGIGDMTAELLYQQGFKTAEEVAAADIETLLEVEGIGEEKAGAILQAARDQIEEKAAAVAAAKAEAAAAAVEAAAAAAMAEAAKTEAAMAAEAVTVATEATRDE
jgi:transcription termination/antitermination protein NusA